MSITRRLEFIARTQLTGAAASVSFQNIPTDYRKFFVVAYCAVGSGGNERLILRFNNDSGANYAYQGLSASATTVAGARVTGATSINVQEVDVIGANNTGLFVIEISKPVSGEVARVTARAAPVNATAAIFYEATAGEWANTTDLISRIDCIALNNLGQFTTGTRVLLYGSRD